MYIRSMKLVNTQYLFMNDRGQAFKVQFCRLESHLIGLMKYNVIIAVINKAVPYVLADYKTSEEPNSEIALIALQTALTENKNKYHGN